MNASRTVMWALGVILVVASLWMFFFMADLDRWIPTSFLAVGILFFVGIAIMSMAEKGGDGDHTSRHETIVDEHHGGSHR